MPKYSNDDASNIEQHAPSIERQTGTDVLKNTHSGASLLLTLPLPIQALFSVARGLVNKKADTNSSKDNDNNNTTQSKRGTSKELENTINQDSKDNSTNIMNEKVDTKIAGWLQWLNDSVQLPTLLKKAESAIMANKIAHEEYEYVNNTNDITNSSIDSALESINYNVNYTLARPLIGNDINNSIPVILSSIAGTLMLFKLVLKSLGLNISLGQYNNCSKKEQETQLYMLESDALSTSLMWDSLPNNGSLNEDIFEDDTLENGLLDLLFTNSSRNKLYGDIRENENPPE